MTPTQKTKLITFLAIISLSIMGSAYYTASANLSTKETTSKTTSTTEMSTTQTTKTSTAKKTTQQKKLAEVQRLLDENYQSENFGIYVMSLDDQSSASINADVIFDAASTGKLPVLYYTQKLINENQLDPATTYPYIDEINQMPMSYMRGGAGMLQSHSFGEEFSIDQIMQLTAQYSDNQGANFLGYYAADQYSDTMKAEISTIIGREWTERNVITAKENALLMSAIYHEGGQLIDYLSDTVYDDQRIPKYLPVPVAHKIGDLYEYRHDVAIVYTDEPYILSVMTNNSSYEAISQLSKDVYDIMK